MSELNKAVFHGVLVAAGVIESLSTRNKLRALLIGACTGWHCYAVYEHIRDMRIENAKSSN